MAVQPDILYQRQREALLPYEDARFRSLTANMADFYPGQTDYTLYGCLMRAVAQELSRIEYMYSYDLVGLEPQYLTPPDAKRRWAAPLFINKSYPTAAQSDVEYQQMIVALLKAYPQGATIAALSGVIAAYTGQQIPIEELYTRIGDGIHDDSDRNAIKLTLDVTSLTPTNPFEETVSAATLAALSQNLYAALDLAKPAHVGLDFSITFGSGEDLRSHTLGLVDTRETIYYGVENAPLPLVFTEAPFEDPSSPDTRLSAIGKLVGEYMQPTLTQDQYDGLISDDFRAEYAPNPEGTYSLLPSATGDIILLNDAGNPTGEISRAQGVLAPQLDRAWQIKGDELTIFRLS